MVYTICSVNRLLWCTVIVQPGLWHLEMLLKSPAPIVFAKTLSRRGAHPCSGVQLAAVGQVQEGEGNEAGEGCQGQVGAAVRCEGLQASQAVRHLAGTSKLAAFGVQGCCLHFRRGDGTAVESCGGQCACCNLPSMERVRPCSHPKAGSLAESGP